MYEAQASAPNTTPYKLHVVYCKAVIPVCERQKKENWKFEVILSYLVSSRPSLPYKTLFKWKNYEIKFTYSSTRQRNQDQDR